MTTVLNDLLRQLDNPQRNDPAEQAAAAAFVRATCPDADRILDALGLEAA